MQNALTIDVEEYFHPTELQAAVGSGGWEKLPSRVSDSTRLVLDLLDTHGVKATFFVLGWVAQRVPELVREIADRKHEIACHSHLHRLVYDLTPHQFHEDTKLAKQVIEDACGRSPAMYRAPSFSITKRSLWALEILAELGFTHDSSIYPISHDRYGIPGFARHAQALSTPSGSIIEVPVASVKLSPTSVAPVGGGGYLRMLPYRYTAAGLRSINRADAAPACVYFHPWELDPQQPRLATGIIARARTYTGLRGMGGKLRRLLSEFSFSTMSEVYPVSDFPASPSTSKKPNVDSCCST